MVFCFSRSFQVKGYNIKRSIKRKRRETTEIIWKGTIFFLNIIDLEKEKFGDGG